MLTAEGCRERSSLLWARLDPEVQAVIIGSAEGLTYFANYYQSPFRYMSSGAQAYLLLLRDQGSVLYIDNLLEPFAAESFVDEAATMTWYRGERSAAPRRLAVSEFAALEIAGRLGRGVQVAVEGGVPAGLAARLQAARPDLRLRSVDDTLAQLRRRKLPDEIALLRRAIGAADHAMQEAMNNITAGMTELEVYSFLCGRAAAYCDEPVLVYGEILSGDRCQQRVGATTQRMIRTGEPVLLDFSVVLRNYRGDISNTFVCEDEPDALQARIHAGCQAAIESAEEVLRVGVPAKRVYEAAVSTLDDLQLRPYFRSHLGHGIGLGHPDPPYFAPESEDVVQEHEVIAIEVGLYLDSAHAARLEKNYLVTSGGLELLSHHPLLPGAGKVHPRPRN